MRLWKIRQYIFMILPEPFASRFQCRTPHRLALCILCERQLDQVEQRVRITAEDTGSGRSGLATAETVASQVRNSTP